MKTKNKFAFYFIDRDEVCDLYTFDSELQVTSTKPQGKSTKPQVEFANLL